MLPNSTLAINDMDMDFKVEIAKKKQFAAASGGAAKILKLKQMYQEQTQKDRAIRLFKPKR